MTKENSSITSGGLFTTLLLVAFIILKLCKVITWSWWWVLSPFWIPVTIAIIVFLVAAMMIKKPKEDDRPYKVTKSKWQERLEEVQSKNN